MTDHVETVRVRTPARPIAPSFCIAMEKQKLLAGKIKAGGAADFHNPIVTEICAQKFYKAGGLSSGILRQ